MPKAYPDLARPPPVADANYSTVRVFYATDRAAANGKHRVNYGDKRGDGRLKLGYCDVSIPRDHQVARIERPSLLRFEFRENPEKHVVLLDVRQQSYDAFYRDVAARTSGLGDGTILLFVHGFNVTFEDAAHRTAQLAYDLGINGAPLMYTWPAPSLYTEAENNSEWTWRHLQWFLADIATRSSAKTVHVIAHSMGNRPLAHALSSLSVTRPQMLPLFQQVFLTAPDIDADVFRQLSDAIAAAGTRVTLYASSEDVALKASHAVHGYSRAGDTHDTVVVVPRIDTIDVSAVDSSLLGHSYFGDQRTLIADIFTLITANTPPVQRFGMAAATSGSLAHFKFLP